MSIFLFFLLILFVVTILVPILRVWLFVRRVKKQSRDMFDRMRGAGPQAGADTGAGTQDNIDPFSFFFMNMGAGEQSSQQTPEAPTQPVKRKKISADVGEYVAYQEVQVSVKVTDDNGQTREVYESESQIIDVEWEDLPPLPEK